MRSTTTITTTTIAILGLAVLSACGNDESNGEAAAADVIAVEFVAGAISSPAQVPSGFVTFGVAAPSGTGEAQVQLLALTPEADEAALATALTTGDLPTALELSVPAGGVDLVAGATKRLTVDLPEGRYLWLDPDTGSFSSVFMARGDASGKAPGPDGTVTLGDGVITLPDGFGRGSFLVETTDDGIHGLTIVALRTPLTDDELLALFTADADLPGTEVVRAGNLGPGRRQAISLDLPPGEYVAASYFPDFDTGAIQAALGMFRSFTVTG